jgi:hypothetical protein
VVNIFGIATTIAINGSKPLYTSAANWAGQVKAGTKFGNALGAAGLLMTGADMVTNGVNTSNTLDATFGVVSFLGVPGAVIGGAYFGANILTLGITGQDIGQHIDNNFIFVSGGPLAPLIPIPIR